MKKYVWPVLLVLPWIYLVSWTLWLTYQRAHGTEVTVSIMGYDPKDLLSGRYIAYQIDWQKTDCQQFEKGICPKKNFCRNGHWGEECRFYVPEKDAGNLDKLFRNRTHQDLHFEAVYAYQKNREPIAKKLLINGTEWQNYLAENK